MMLCRRITAGQRCCPVARHVTLSPRQFARTYLIAPVKHNKKSARALSSRVRAAASEPTASSKQQESGKWHWSTATVVSNRAESADGSVRSICLSVEDHVTYLDGRKIRHRAEAPRWIDAYKVPGQFVGLHDGAEPPSSSTVPLNICALASSPYDAKRDSALLDAALIEVLIDRNGDAFESRVSDLAPGSLLHVSQVVGSGFGTLFTETEGLCSAMEDNNNLVLVGAGTKGMGVLRACVEWTPVQAHATAHKVALFLVAPSPTAAAYVKDWDTWRAAGVDVQPVYLGDSNGSNGRNGSSRTSVKDALETALFGSEDGGIVAPAWQPCTVLMSGLAPEVVAAVTKRLTAHGIDVQRILCCE